MLLSYLLSFGVTVAIEWVVLVLFGYRSRRTSYASAIVNAFTHPVLHIGLYALIQMRIPIFYPLIAAEIALIPLEALLLSKLLGKTLRVLLLPSALMNMASFLAPHYLNSSMFYR